MPRPRSQQPAPPVPKSRTALLISLALIAATLLLYIPVYRADFVNYDDPDYVSHNPHVAQGLSTSTIAWAFTSTEAANWFPLTRLSHLLDGQLFGLDPAAHHASNVVLHALAAVLLFAFLNRATGALWPSAIVAFVFALHPAHVESAAWISERKDTLSAVFWFATLYAYVRYTERRGPARYAATLALFALGLLSKPMVVTLPFVILLLHIWPLPRRPIAVLLRELTPFFALSLASAAITYFAQNAAGAVKALSSIPLGTRIANAIFSYAAYLQTTFFPSDLAVFYPYPSSIPAAEIAISLAVLAAISFAVWRFRRAHLYLAFGWLWFLGTLVPVIGIVQVGAQARADRYLYLPMTGLVVMTVFGAHSILRAKPAVRTGVYCLAASAATACVFLTWRQAGYWKNSGTLFEHALAVTQDNYIAEHNLGSYLLDVPGHLPDSIAHLRAALRIDSSSARAHTDLGIAYSKLGGHLPQAVDEFQAALRTEPNSPIVHNDFGNALLESGRRAEAAAEYQAALRLDPDYADARRNLSIAVRSSEPEPASAEELNNRAVGLAGAGREREAIPLFEAALQRDPNYADAHLNLGIALSKIPGRLHDAITHLETANRLRPDPQVQEEIRRLKR